MTPLKRILVVLTILLMYTYGPQIKISAQTVPANEVRLTSRTAPTGLTGRYRVYVDSTDGLLHCIKPDGSNCISATTSISVGTTTTGAAGTSASVTNSGTSSAPVLNFTIPQGLPGGSGPAGPGFTFRGAWQPSTAYNAMDVVTNGGNTYEADHSFTSASIFGAANWNLWASAGATGPAGGVTSFSTGTFPSWLTPTVTNATSTPSLSVSGGTVPIANGGTGATTQQTALNNLTGAQTAGRYVRSDGTNAALSAIQAGDVPTLNQNTTGKATGNNLSLGWGPIAGNVSQTAGNQQARTTLPTGITVISFTLSLTVGFTGCTTFPTYQLYDFTAATAISTLTMVASTTYYSNTGLSVAVASGHDIGLRVGTGGAGCTGGSNAAFTMWYTM